MNLALRFFVALLVATRFFDSEAQVRELTFEERVRAQAAIERVYYSHQIGAERPFEQMVPRSVLERKVRTYLEQSAALDAYWKTPVTAEMLEREAERMARQTRMPERLRELFAALGHDAFLVQECLARPALVDRLARSFFASDERVHGHTRREAERLREAVTRGSIDPASSHPRRTVVSHVVPERPATETLPSPRVERWSGEDSVRRLKTRAGGTIRRRIPGRRPQPSTLRRYVRRTQRCGRAA